MQKPGLFGMNGVFVFLLSFLSVAAYAQQAGSLILIDAENRQAFTVRIGDQLYASSGHGHLVLSHLKDSSYRLNLRFPKKNLAEQVFPVTVHQKDLGFQLRGSDTTWVLYNWQTKETIRTINEKDSSRMLDQGVKREDGFSKLMAAVVNDTSVMYNTYNGNGFRTDSSNSNTQLPTPNGQRPTINDQLPTHNDQRPTANAQPPVIPSPIPVVTIPDKKHIKDSLLAVKRANAALKDSLLVVKKANMLKDSELSVQRSAAIRDSLGMVKKTAESKDSLQTAQKAIALKDSPTVTTNQRPPTTDQRPTNFSPGIKKLREVSLKISRKLVFLDVDKEGLVDTVTLFVYFETNDTAVKKPPVTEPAIVAKNPAKRDSASLTGAVVKNKPGPALKSTDPGCSQLATETDLETVRSAILSANSEQDKISVASGAFALKCFSVVQVRVLAALFVSDKSRYHLMEAARLRISDQDHFRELADMYTDKNFQKKFLQMAGKRS